MRAHRFLSAVLTTFFLVSLKPASVMAADRVTMAQAMAAGSSFSCLDYGVVGVCFWLKCGWKCKVKTSPKIKHYVPDLVVQVYNDHKQPPLVESTFSTAHGATNYSEKSADAHYSSRKVKAADAIGNPLSKAFGFASSFGYVCAGAATPYFPYFNSFADFVAWRLSVPEMVYPQSINIFNNLSADGKTWGNLYPRNGYITQSDPYKAGAILAQRVGDVVTRSGQPHVYRKALANRKEGYWPAGALNPKDEDSGKWQMLVPRQSSDCAVFPNASTDVASNRSETGGYAWNLWRPYKCCKRRGQKFLFDIEWGS